MKDERQNNIIIKAKREYPPLIKSDIKLTVGILVSNHIKYIRKGLEAVKPLLDAVPSELIVVDTVGPENSDGSLEVVKEYTDKIYHFDWINDFSAARNVAMDHAKGEWFMYFDDDEYFDDVTEFIEFFNSGECDKYYAGVYLTGDYITPELYQKNGAGRMIRRTVNTRFEGYVHEQFNEIFSPVKQFTAFTHHFGYLFETPEQKQAKSERNMQLLEKELKEKGPNARICAQIVGNMLGEDDIEANKKCAEYIRLLEGTDELNKSCGQWMLTAQNRLMVKWENLEGILDMEKKYLEKGLLQETARLVICLQAASIAYCRRDYKMVSDRVKTYFELLDWLNAHPDDKVLQTQFDFPSFMMDQNLFTMTKIGIVAENKLRNFDRAYAYIKKLDFDFCTDFKEMETIMKTTFKGLEDIGPAVEFYRGFYKDEFFEVMELRKYLPGWLADRLK